MTMFIYNNSKNASTGQILFKFNCGYHPYIFFKDKCNVRSISSSAKKLAVELRKLINVCHQNFLHAQDLQKQAHNKKVKLRSYVLGEKVWLNSKPIKTKRN